MCGVTYVETPHKFEVKAPRVQEFKRAMLVKPIEVERYCFNLFESINGWGGGLEPFQVLNFDEVGIGGKEESSRAPGKIVAMKDENGETTGDLFVNERGTPRVTFVPIIAASGANISTWMLFQGSESTEESYQRMMGTCAKVIHQKDSCYMTSDTLAKHLVPTIKEYRNALKLEQTTKILVLADGHQSRYNVDLWAELSANHIRLLLLPAHTSDFLQPVDNGVARSLKPGPLLVNRYNIDGSDTANIDLSSAIPEFCRRVSESSKPEIITNSFRKCGIRTHDTTNRRMKQVRLDLTVPGNTKNATDALVENNVIFTNAQNLIDAYYAYLDSGSATGQRNHRSTLNSILNQWEPNLTHSKLDAGRQQYGGEVVTHFKFRKEVLRRRQRAEEASRKKAPLQSTSLNTNKPSKNTEPGPVVSQVDFASAQIGLISGDTVGFDDEFLPNYEDLYEEDENLPPIPKRKKLATKNGQFRRFQTCSKCDQPRKGHICSLK